jgi:predicted acetyltransferase
MSNAFTYRVLSGLDEGKELGVILAQCFNSSLTDETTYLDRFGIPNFRVLYHRSMLVGGLVQIPMGQWFGGQVVPMTGIASVGIAPEHRGTGAALFLLQQTVKELYSQGVPLSVLYPATQRLYRQIGYEQGGSRCFWELQLDQIHIKERSLPMQSVPLITETFQPLYQQQAKRNDGNLQRNLGLWQEILQVRHQEPLYAYVMGDAAQPEGYVIFNQTKIDGYATLVLRDWVTLTPTAARMLLTFMADHRSQIDKMRWRSSLTDPFTLLLPEQSASLHNITRWMLRIINVEQALQARGYTKDITAELHLQVTDELLPENSDRWILEVVNGQGKVRRGGKADLKLSILALATLYTGLFSPQQLYLLGQLEATEAAMAIASLLFGGLSPWMPDFF